MFDDHLHHHSDGGASDGRPNRTGKVRASRSMSILSVFIGALMLLFFLRSGGLSAFGSFGLIWMIGLVAIIGYHLFNSAGGTTRPSLYEIELPDGGETGASVEERLDTLVDLRERGAISSAEYQRQRQRILDGL
ncbi:MAG: SHOCT domain-containing protein [Actinomycetota bacterium]